MTEQKRLYRSRSDKMLAGVAGGMAKYFSMDATLMRVLWVLAGVFLFPAGVIVYVVLALVIPEEPVDAPAVQTQTPPPPPAEQPPGQ